MDPQLMWLIIAAAALIVIGLLASAAMRKRRSEHLRKQFGPEYERTVRDSRSTSTAERELLARQREASQLSLTQISASDAARLSSDFARIEKTFVERPALALAEADEIVTEALRLRGFPATTDFDGRAKLVSVHYPRVMGDYRDAHRVLSVDTPGKLNTEEMRQALLRYRNVLSELVGGAADREQPIAPHAETIGDERVGRRATDARENDRLRH